MSFAVLALLPTEFVYDTFSEGWQKVELAFFWPPQRLRLLLSRGRDAAATAVALFTAAWLLVQDLRIGKRACVGLACQHRVLLARTICSRLRG